MFYFFFFKQKTAYEMRISDWSSDVCSSDLRFRDRADYALYAEIPVGAAGRPAADSRADPAVRAAAKLVVRDPGAAGPRDLATGCEQSDQRPSGALCALGDRRRLSVGSAGHRYRRLSPPIISGPRTSAPTRRD